MDSATKAQVTEALRNLIIDLFPDAHLRPMYGGTVIELAKDDPKSRIGGLYVYEAHVSLEFAKGVLFSDPNGQLEGSGKHRRHLKLHSLDHIETKDCQGFLQQALAA